MKLQILPIVLAVFLPTGPLAFGAESWSAFLDFWSKAAAFPGTTTPNTWSHGSAATSEKDPTASFTAFGEDNLEIQIPTGGPLYKHANPGAPEPCVARANEAWYPGAPPMPPYLFVHPGENRYAIVRWKAPKAGSYQVKATFLASGETGMKDVGIVRYKEAGAKAEVMKSTLINRETPQSDQAKYEGSLKLDEGEFVAFYVGDGGDGHASDAVGLDVVITSEK